ncbi:urease accessory protein UreD [Microbulbifer sp.]|uniref:urease accessory protein UreD n=1 Tax=Microbulbifer sp. TaxID=1908541 RepID=UPI002588CDE2|nr:urease accessory protein UreD [Microbulbifer sp.]
MNQLAVAESPLEESAAAGRWHADLDLRFECGERGCRLARNHHRGPLYVQKPFFPEGRDLAHVYLLHPPGGLVSGDRLDIRAVAEKGARALVTTTGAGRVYRARPDGLLQSQNTALRVAPGASLEWLPLENIAYPGANGAMNMRVDLSVDSHFSGWEITSLGLPACDAPFASGRLLQRLEIFREGVPLLIEALRLGGGSNNPLAARAGLRGFPVNGLMVMGPFKPSPSESLLGHCREMIEVRDGEILGGISFTAEMLVVRALGFCGFEMRALFTGLWEILRPELLHRPACAPRIWRT